MPDIELNPKYEDFYGLPRAISDGTGADNILRGEEGGFREGVCMWGYEEGTRGKCDWFQYCGTKKTFSQGPKTEGTEPIKSLA